MVRLFPANRLRRGFFAAGLCLALSACDTPWLEEVPSLDLDTALSKGWLFGDKDAAAAPKTAQPVYCYETIGVGECYDQPLDDGGNRLIGFEGPAPAITPLPPKP
ncbi:MAG: hypothetical protein ACI8S3_002495 [Alphaproteobacteria bacterium]|jgi:hypothetical protein